MTTTLAHDPTAGPDGTDYLITWHPDGSGEFATRPGKGWTWETWSAPEYMPAREGAAA